MPRLSKFLRVKIIVLWEQHHSLREIAKELNISRKAVRLWVRRFQETGDVVPKPQGRRPVTYTDECDRHRDIVRMHIMDPFKSTRSSAEKHGVSLSTVRKHLHQAGIHNYKPAKKIQLTEDHRNARIAFARQYLNFDRENNIVIFTDEKTFKSDKDGRKILWRRPNERYSTQNILPLRSSGRITSGYWGWMAAMGPGELIEIGGRMKSKDYLGILRDEMLPSVRNIFPEGQIYLVQDNCSVHCSKLVTDWLATQQDITVISWPSKSPDLNVIENLWGLMILNWDSSEIKTNYMKK